MSTTEKSILRAARKWWDEHYPHDYSVDERLALPRLNTFTPAEHALADAVASDVRSGQYRAETLAKVRALKTKANETRKAFGLEPLFPKPQRSERRASKSATRAEKRGERGAIRARVFKRAEVDGVPRCEGPPESDPRNDGRCVRDATELLHVFGRGRGREPESERNCLAACGWCHRAETQNRPDGASWWRYFANLFGRWGFTRSALLARQRAEFESTRSTLGAGLRERGA